MEQTQFQAAFEDLVKVMVRQNQFTMEYYFEDFEDLVDLETWKHRDHFFMQVFWQLSAKYNNAELERLADETATNYSGPLANQ